MFDTLRRGTQLPRDAFTFADYKIGRDVFGHTNKLTCTWPGEIARWRARTNSNLSSSQNRYTDQAIKLRERGIVELSEPRDEETISRIQERFEEILENEEYTYTRGALGTNYTYGIASDSFDFAKNIPEISGIISDGVSEILRNYYDAHFKPVRVNMWRNHHVPQEVVDESEVFSNYWHTDPHTTDHVKIFVNLTDVTERDGPFHAITLDDSYDITKQYKRQRDGVPNGRVKDEATDILKFTGKAGSTALCNTTLTLHRAGIPEEGRHRDLLQMVFAPSDEPVSDDWLQEVDEFSLTGSDHNGFRRLLRY